MRVSEIERFESHFTVNPTTGCHEWTRARNKKGYGQFSVRRTPAERACCKRGGNKRVQAHKWVFEYHNGKVAQGLEVDHRCCNPSCVNLAHLQAITKAKNLELRGRVHLETFSGQ